MTESLRSALKQLRLSGLLDSLDVRQDAAQRHPRREDEEHGGLAESGIAVEHAHLAQRDPVRPQPFEWPRLNRLQVASRPCFLHN
jgi:hypothetical protein